MMKKLLQKLNYRGQQRIAILKSDDGFFDAVASELENVTVDKEIDPRCPYGFIIVFVKTVAEVESVSPVVLHNLTADGILWFCYPKKSSNNYKSDISRDHGWKPLTDSGFYGIRMVSVDDDWSAMRFRNIKYIKSTSNRYTNGN
jgi:hypothetical protein